MFHRAREEYIVTKEILHQLRTPCNRVVLRRTDRSEVFHLGSTEDYQQKAIMYMQKTCVYEEVKNGRCPLAENLSAVLALLDRLLKNKANGSQTMANDDAQKG